MADQKKHKTWWDEENKIIRLQVFGDYDEQDAQNTVDKIAETKQRFLGKSPSFLIDLTKANKLSSKARKIIVEKIYKDPKLNRIATIASSVLVRTINSFLITASGLEADKVKMFKTEEEALKWLNIKVNL